MSVQYRKLVDITIGDYNLDTLRKSWEWFNDPEIKELTNAADIDKENQMEWFESLKNRNDYFIKSILHNEKIIGIFGLKKITNHDGEFWVTIGEKEYWGKTIGPQVLEYILDYALSLGLTTIYIISLKNNFRTIKSAKKMGFCYEKDLDEKNVILRKALK